MLKHYIHDYHDIVTKFKQLVRNTLISPSETIVFQDFSNSRNEINYTLSMFLREVLDKLGDHIKRFCIGDGVYYQNKDGSFRLIQCRKFDQSDIPNNIKCKNIITDTVQNINFYDIDALRKYISENKKLCVDHLINPNKVDSQIFNFKYYTNIADFFEKGNLFFFHMLKWCLTDNSHIIDTLKNILNRDSSKEIFVYL